MVGTVMTTLMFSSQIRSVPPYHISTVLRLHLLAEFCCSISTDGIWACSVFQILVVFGVKEQPAYWIVLHGVSRLKKPWDQADAASMPRDLSLNFMSRHYVLLSATLHVQLALKSC